MEILLWIPNLQLYFVHLFLNYEKDDSDFLNKDFSVGIILFSFKDKSLFELSYSYINFNSTYNRKCFRFSILFFVLEINKEYQK